MTNDNYCGDSDEENRRRRILCNDRRLASSTGEKKLNMKYNYGCINMIPPIYGVGSIFTTVIVNTRGSINSKEILDKNMVRL